LETIVSNDYTPFDNVDNEECEMTLLIGARCVDGVVLIGDRKVTQTLSSGIHYVYDDKITGEIDGILTGFAGDGGAFEVFRTTLRDYVTSTRNEIKKSRHYKKTDPTFDQFKLKVSQIQHDFYTKYQQRQYRVLMGVSSNYFASKKSSVYLYERDGRCFPQNEHITIGSVKSMLGFHPGAFIAFTAFTTIFNILVAVCFFIRDIQVFVFRLPAYISQIL
jgi:20S proteasome alpha/beta subunit